MQEPQSKSTMASLVLAVGGLSTWKAPLYADGLVPPQRPRPSELPLLTYLPGFDGSLVAPFLQWPSLGDSFDIEGLEISMADRSSFAELCSAVRARLEREPPSRPLVLMGESFGAVLALRVALSLAEDGRPLDGLALVNPATSYPRSELARRAPGVSRLPEPAYPFGVLSLLPLFADAYQLPQLLKIIGGAKLPAVIDSPEREAYMGRVAFSLPRRLSFMPRATLSWRLHEWLATGSAEVNAMAEQLARLPTRTCIVAGEDDRTLPSVDEAERLARLLPHARVTRVHGAGHAATCGSRVSLARVFSEAFEDLDGFSPPAALPDAELYSPQSVSADGSLDELGLIDRPHPSVRPWTYWQLTAPSDDAVR